MARDLAYLRRIRQTRLRNHQYRTIKGSDPFYAVPMADELKHVVVLQVCLGTKEDRILAGKTFQRARNVQDLEIKITRTAQEGTLGTSADATVTAINTLFGASSEKPVRQLSRLHLVSMDLTRAGVIIPTLGDLKGLKSLLVTGCLASQNLLVTLTQLPPPLSGLIIIYIEYSRLDALSAFMESSAAASSLATLRVTGNLCLAASDNKFSKSLQTLAPALKVLELLDLEDDCGVFSYPNAEYYGALALFQAMDNLEQLAIQVSSFERPYIRCSGGLDSV